MINCPELNLEWLIESLYSSGYGCHGDLGLELGGFSKHLFSVVDRYLGSGASRSATINFINNLHTNDLYLAIACAEQKDVAWNRFNSIYNKYIGELAVFVSPNRDAARDLAANLLVDMFLPDCSGRSRIASYDGRSALATWLRIIISRRAINERERKCNKMGRIESMPEIADEMGLRSIEADLRSHQYEYMIKDSFKWACKELIDRERLLLLLRYEDELQLNQIARLLGVHQSTVTRQLVKIQEKLRDEVVSILASKYHLSHAAIEECLADILENPSHSILASIKQH
jgi:RNA polymerase sigma-70 factor, ECF subfamily